MCADPVFRVGTPAPKLFVRAIVTRHEIVKEKNGAQRRMFLFFPIRPGEADEQTSRSQILLPLFPDSMRRIRNERLIGPLCRRMVSAVVHALPGRAAVPIRRPSRLHPGAAGSVPGGSVHPDFHRDADQVGMVLGPELLLEQGRGVGDGLVRDAERLSDLDDLVAAPE